MSESQRNIVHTKTWGQHISEAKKGKPQPKFTWRFPGGSTRVLSKQVASRYYIRKGIEIVLVEHE